MKEEFKIQKPINSPDRKVERNKALAYDVLKYDMPMKDGGD